ncbi:MAG: AMP-binding protein [Planctomycetota bacterium]
MTSTCSTDALTAALANVREATRSRKVFLTYADPEGNTRELSYGELWDRSARIRALCQQWGLRPRDRVLVASADDGMVAALVLACLEGGYSCAVVDPGATPAEAALVRSIAAPSVIAADEDRRSTWEAPDAKSLPIAAAHAGSRIFQRLLGRRTQHRAPSLPGLLADLNPVDAAFGGDDEAEAYVLFTSGSSSRPKGVRISRRALAAHAATLIAHLGYDEDARLLDVLPLHHTDGLMHGVLTPYLARASAIRPLRFSLDRTAELCDAIYTFRATHLIAVPTMLAFMDRFGIELADTLKTADFRFAITSAAPMPAELWERFEARFGVRVVNVYGLTETVCGGLFCGPDDETYRLGTVGKPVDVECRIVDDSGADVPAGTEGELLLRGQNITSGYLGNPDATARALCDGWFRTGDLAAVDADGFFHIIGRKKSLVISGGVNIQPEEVTRVIEQVAGVTEAVAFGIPDDSLGEVLVACYAGAADAPDAPGTPDPAALLALCRERLSSHKVPRHVVRLDTLPRGGSGKVDLPRVRERWFAEQRTEPSRQPAGSVRARVLEAAGRVFRLETRAWSDDDGPGVTNGWDSFAHLSFVLELERAFGLRLKTADVMAIRSLGDAVRTLEARIVSR